MVVEDDAAIRMLIAATLEERGYRVEEAADGLTALAAARAHTPDVILLDIGLPDIDGLTVLARLKEDVLLRKVPVLMVTAWSEPDFIRIAMDRGASDYVCKPFDVADLGARVDAATRRTPWAGDPADREHLDTVLDRQSVAAIRTGRPFGVLVAELDTIDEDALRAAAKRMRLRGDVSDVIVRHGRSRFALVIPGADLDAARTRAARLCAVIAEGPLDTGYEMAGVTAICGVAAYAPGEHGDEVLARAEADLDHASRTAATLFAA